MFSIYKILFMICQDFIYVKIYQFSIVSTPNYYKFSGLKTLYCLIVLYFRSLILVSLGSNEGGSRTVPF